MFINTRLKESGIKLIQDPNMKNGSWQNYATHNVQKDSASDTLLWQCQAAALQQSADNPTYTYTKRVLSAVENQKISTGTTEKHHYAGWY